MPKGTRPIGEFWGAIVPVLDSDGNQVYHRDENGKLTWKPMKTKVCMDDAIVFESPVRSGFFDP
jgi:hypothetical protein